MSDSQSGGTKSVPPPHTAHTIGPCPKPCPKCGEDRLVTIVTDARGRQGVCDVCSHDWWLPVAEGSSRAGDPDISPQPKNPVTAWDARRARRLERESIDRAGNEIVHARSGRICELPGGCKKTVRGEPHHLEGGYGRRARGPSVLASHKVDLCPDHHRAVTDGKVGLRWDARDPFGTLERAW